MAVTLTKSTYVTNLDATPVILNPGYTGHGRLREMCSIFDITNADSVGSIVRILRVWSSWRVSELLLDSPDIGTTTVADFGLYDISATNAGAVVSVAFFASAIVLNAGPLVKTDITVESAVIATANRAKRIWEQLGLAADPQKFYDVSSTLTGAADATGTSLLRCRYVDGT